MDTLTEKRRADIIAGNYRPRLGGITPERRAEIIDALKVQRNAARVAAQFDDLSHGSILVIAKQEGIKLTKQRPWGGGKEKSIPASTRNGIIKALKANPTAAARIAAQFEVGEAIVRKLARKANIAPPKATPLSRKKRARILDALEVNPNGAQVARQVGVSRQSVYYIAKAADIELTAGKAAWGRPRLPAEKRAEIIEVVKANQNATQTARQIGGVSAKAVYRIAKDEGIPLRRGRSPSPVAVVKSPVLDH